MSRRIPGRGSLASTLLVTLALLGLVLAAASIPHSHIGLGLGLYNQEHDLSLLAAGGAALPTPEAPAVVPLAVVAGALALASLAPAEAPRSLSRPRAPPLR
jgi:hypothetical protein